MLSCVKRAVCTVAAFHFVQSLRRVRRQLMYDVCFKCTLIIDRWSSSRSDPDRYPGLRQGLRQGFQGRF